MKRLFVIFLMPFQVFCYEGFGNKELCSNTDDRVSSHVPQIGRLSKTNVKSACTATLVGKDCVVTAWHCFPAFERVEFNVPLSTAEGKMNRSQLTDTYFLDPSFKFVVRPTSKETEFHDFAVLKLKPNEVTGLSAGEAYGSFEIDDTPVCVEEDLTIIGYGTTNLNPLLNWVQSEGYGNTVEVKSNGVIHYRVSTTLGNSGGALFSAYTGKIVGIHLAGGCNATGGANKGILFSYYPELVEAIHQCNASSNP